MDARSVLVAVSRAVTYHNLGTDGFKALSDLAKNPDEYGTSVYRAYVYCKNIADWNTLRMRMHDSIMQIPRSNTIARNTISNAEIDLDNKIEEARIYALAYLNMAIAEIDVKAGASIRGPFQ